MSHVWAVFSVMLDGDEWIDFALVSLHENVPEGMVVADREDFSADGQKLPEGIGRLPRAYSNPRAPDVFFAEKVEVLP